MNANVTPRPRCYFAIDTGAYGLLLSPSAASALHRVPDTLSKTGGIGYEGDVDSFAANVAPIKIGQLEFSQLRSARAR